MLELVYFVRQKVCYTHSKLFVPEIVGAVLKEDSGCDDFFVAHTMFPRLAAFSGRNRRVTLYFILSTQTFLLWTGRCDVRCRA